MSFPQYFSIRSNPYRIRPVDRPQLVVNTAGIAFNGVD
jgi:hypothetical protein